MSPSADLVKKRAPTFYGIIIFKLLKGSLFVTLALVAYTLSDNDLPAEFRKLLHVLQVTPANKFFAHLTVSVGKLSEADLLWASLGTLIYSSFSLVEGVGMIFHQKWACWLAIGESAFFIPIEIYELARPEKFSWFVFGILVINVVIVIYLFRNRDRLFGHHGPS